jgi:hypothetical protein
MWHANRWQSIIVNRDEALYEEWQKGRVYPSGGAASQAEWEALVAEFLAGIEKALWWTESPERLKHETDPGHTMADVLVSLAVHTAHHLGKIVALRQFIDAWETESREP